jgi:beta-lactamase superfamily II metal-dependent hydrolase
MEVHFIDVGCGNMVLILLPEGSIFMYDCNITNDNKQRVLSYVKKIIGNKGINVFINSHRDADHMRGIKDLHAANTIESIWDSGVPGTTTNTSEYNDYMDLRRSVSSKKIKALDFDIFGDVVFVYMNSECEDYTDPNEQSVVLKIEFRGSSVMLGGDTNYRPWKEKILNYYSDKDLQTSIFLAPHHGSIDFFDDPGDSQHYYMSHIQKIKPAMTLISVGPNIHRLPDSKALELYEKYSTGSNQGNKVFSTEDKGTMKLILKDGGGWSLSVNQ